MRAGRPKVAMPPGRVSPFDENRTFRHATALGTRSKVKATRAGPGPAFQPREMMGWLTQDPSGRRPISRPIAIHLPRTRECARRSVFQRRPQLCTRLGRVLDVREVALVLEDTARILGAVGLVVWSWDSRTSVLRPWLAYGYSEAVLARFSTIPTNAENGDCCGVSDRGSVPCSTAAEA